MSENRFTVGDKVEHDTRGAGEIVYGPFVGWAGNRNYLVKYDDGRSVPAMPDVLTARPAFKAGDTVKAYSRAYTVVAGPFPNDNAGAFYVVDEDGFGNTTVHAAHMSLYSATDAPISVGDRVKILAGQYLTGSIGKVGTVTSVTQAWGAGGPNGVHRYLVRRDGGAEIYVSEVEKVTDAPSDTETIDGATYDLSATYTDTDGDAWQIARIDGVVRATTALHNAPSRSSHTLEYVASAYGPMRKI